MRSQIVAAGVLLVVLALGALGGLVLGYRQLDGAVLAPPTAGEARGAFMTLVGLVVFMAIAGTVVGGVLCRPLVRWGRRTGPDARR